MNEFTNSDSSLERMFAHQNDPRVISGVPSFTRVDESRTSRLSREGLKPFPDLTIHNDQFRFRKSRSSAHLL